MAENFRLGAAQGAIYVVGALAASAVAGRLDHRRAAMLLHVLMAAACGVGVWAGERSDPVGVTAVLLAYTLLSAMAWPILESIVSMGTDAATLARRIATYNVVWPAAGTATLAVSGRVIEAIPIGMFLFPAGAHLLSVVAAAALRKVPLAPAATPAVAEHPHAEPELLRLRTVALWVSRLGLPATYAVIYGLMPLMPTLPAMARLDVPTQTVVSSTWLLARWLTFLALALHPWWHTRPRAMVAAAGAMLLAFGGIVLAPSTLLGAGVHPSADLAALIGWQVMLGAALGVIYTGSLYFGMVLSEGSTEHSGYHEALIGFGWVLGPGAGAVAQVAFPGHPYAGVVAVGTVIALSVLAVFGAGFVLRERNAEDATAR
ncbi:MAG TPA: hypothetical protein VF796_01040 [Humisphaera sp.]